MPTLARLLLAFGIVIVGGIGVSYATTGLLTAFEFVIAPEPVDAPPPQPVRAFSRPPTERRFDRIAPSVRPDLESVDPEPVWHSRVARPSAARS